MNILICKHLGIVLGGYESSWSLIMKEKRKNLTININWQKTKWLWYRKTEGAWEGRPMQSPSFGETTAELALRECPVPAWVGRVTRVTNRKLQRNLTNALRESFTMEGTTLIPPARVILVALPFMHSLGAFSSTAAYTLSWKFPEE